MILKRAIGFSVLAYIASLAIGTVVAVVAGIDLGETEAIPPLLWYVGAFVSVLFAVVFARLYFRSPHAIAGVREGLYFGLIMIATGFVMDFITLLPLLTHEDPWGPILQYYTDPLFWVTIGLVLAGTILTGRHLARRVGA